MSFPLDIFHILIVLSADPDAKSYLFGENATLFTEYICPMRVLMRSPLDILHISIFLEYADAKSSPLGENAKLFTW